MKEAVLTLEMGGAGPGAAIPEEIEAAESDLRDKLALERTFLAKERTILSYVRTGITFIGVALFIWRFVEVGDLFRYALFVLFVIPGAYATLYGMYKIMVRRRERKVFEDNYMAVRKKWKVKSKAGFGPSGQT